jgi:adenosylhomocysteine nucleosidase
LKILVTFAVEPEFAPWKKSRDFIEAKVADVSIFTATIDGVGVDVVLTGMGPVNARRAVGAVISNSYAACISSGFAGSLKREHIAGEVLIAESVQCAEDARVIRCDATLVRQAETVGGTKKVEKFLSAEKIAGSKEEKSRLAGSGDAIEMESDAVLSVAAEHQVPAVAVRAISDRFDEDMPVDFSGSIDERGQILKGKLALEIAGDPLKIPALIRLGRQSKLASEHLMEFFESYVESLSVEGRGGIGAAFEKVARG